MSENNKFDVETGGYIPPKYLIDLHLVEDQLVVSMEKVPCWFRGKMPCYCRSGTFEEGVAIEPPDQSPDCYMYEELDKALKEWKGE